MTRERLPQRRRNENITINWMGTPIELSFGYDESHNKVKEVFVSTRKLGTDMDSMARDTAVMLSFLLQYGVDLNELLDVFASDKSGTSEGFASKVAKLIIAENEKPTTGEER